MAEDSTFVVHKEWLNNINGLTIEQQDRIISDFVRYGTGLPMAHADDQVVQSFVNMLKGRIDFSKDKYNQKMQMASASGKKKKVNDEDILRLAREGKNSRQIAEILGCSKSAVDHSEGWKKRHEVPQEYTKDFIF